MDMCYGALPCSCIDGKIVESNLAFPCIAKFILRVGTTEGVGTICCLQNQSNQTPISHILTQTGRYALNSDKLTRARAREDHALSLATPSAVVTRNPAACRVRGCCYARSSVLGASPDHQTSIIAINGCVLRQSTALLKYHWYYSILFACCIWPSIDKRYKPWTPQKTGTQGRNRLNHGQANPPKNPCQTSWSISTARKIPTTRRTGRSGRKWSPRYSGRSRHAGSCSPRPSTRRELGKSSSSSTSTAKLPLRASV